jgi:hypothetical protein
MAHAQEQVSTDAMLDIPFPSIPRSRGQRSIVRRCQAMLTPSPVTRGALPFIKSSDRMGSTAIAKVEPKMLRRSWLHYPERHPLKLNPQQAPVKNKRSRSLNSPILFGSTD